ncbi:MAG: glycosyltransferase [Marinobacterium sp.]
MPDKSEVDLEKFKALPLPTEEEIIDCWVGDINQPKISICCITYNHELYIEDALKGFLIQKTNVPFEILIHDDASVDKTPSIIKSYKDKYPRIIKTFFKKENVWSKGKRFIIVRYLVPHAKGKYLAFCEGDDFWIDSFKLDKQYEVMQATPSLSMCAHSVHIMNEKEVAKKQNRYSKLPGRFDLNNVLVGHGVPTLSIFCKNEFSEFLKFFDKKITSGDKAIILFLLKSGDGSFIGNEMGFYRTHSEGVTRKDRTVDEDIENFLNLISCGAKFLNKDQLEILKNELAIVYLVAMKNSAQKKCFFRSISYFYKAVSCDWMSVFKIFMRKF